MEYAAARDEDAAPQLESDARISAYTSRPDRTVFTESGNPDGWIATDLAVDLQR
jgi:hypothetical protein